MQEGLHGRRVAVMVALLTACYVFSLIDRLVINLLVDPIKADLGLSDLQIALIQGPAFAILYATSGAPLGRFADIFNRRRLAAGAIAFWSICTALTGTAGNFLALALARVGVGVGEAALTPAAYSLFADSVRPNRLGRVISIYTAGGALGSGLALLAGGAIYTLAEQAAIGIAPWRITLFVVALPGLLLALLILAFVIEPSRRTQGERASVTAVLGHIARARLFYGWTFTAYAALSTLLYAFMAWTPSLLVRGYALTPGTAGVRFGTVMLFAGVAGPLLAGWLADRSIPRKGAIAPLHVMTIGFTGVAIGAALLWSGTGLTGATLLLGLIGLFATGMLSLPPIALQLATAGNMRGLVSGINLMIGNLLGMGIGPVAVALLTARGSSLPGALALVMMLAAAIGMVAVLLVRPAQSLDESTAAL